MKLYLQKEFDKDNKNYLLKTTIVYKNGLQSRFEKIIKSRYGVFNP